VDTRIDTMTGGRLKKNHFNNLWETGKAPWKKWKK